jgi:hypothetical protein
MYLNLFHREILSFFFWSLSVYYEQIPPSYSCIFLDFVSFLKKKITYVSAVKTLQRSKKKFKELEA